MSYTITNNIMYVRNDTGELVPVSMIASGATTKDAILYTAQELTNDQQAQARTNIGAADTKSVDALNREVMGYESVEPVKYYRMEFDKVIRTPSGNLSPSANAAEVRFYTADGVECAVEAVQADSEYSSSHVATNVLDGNMETFWSSKDASGVVHTLDFTLTEPAIATKIGIVLRKDIQNGILDALTVKASADGVAWKEVLHFENEKDGWVSQGWRYFSLNPYIDKMEAIRDMLNDEGAVLYTAQELTEEQKTQARTNIAAADADAVEMLDGILNGRTYTETHEVEISATAGKGIDGFYFEVDIKTGEQYTMTLIQDGVFAGGAGLALYEINAEGGGTTVGTLKASENWTIRKAANVDIKSFKVYAPRSLIVGSGTMTLRLEIPRSASVSIKEKIEKLEAENAHLMVDNHFMLFTDKVLRGIDGVAADYSGWIATDYVDLTKRTRDTVTLNATVYGGFGVAFYDKRQVFISGVTSTNIADYGYSEGSSPQQLTLPLPEGCCYLRATMSMGSYGSGARFNVTYPSTEVRAYYEIPEYYHADCYFEKKYNRINSLMLNSVVNGDVFIFITDEHWANERAYESNNQGHSIGLIRCLSDYLRIPRLFSGGDTGEYGSGLFANLLRENFGGDIHHVMGNHDYFNQDNQNASLYMRMDFGSEKQIGNHKRHYYYVDNQHQKIRYIVLSAFAWNEGGSGSPAANGYEAEQLEWLKNEALEVGADWTVLIFTHWISGEVETWDNAWTQAIDAKNTNNNIAAILQGHLHVDWISHTAGGIPIITTTCDKNLDMEYRPNGTIKEQAFDVCVLDKEARTLTMVRIGCPVMEGSDEANWTLSEERVVTY